MSPEGESAAPGENMAARWSTEHVVAEHRDLQANTMSVDSTGQYALLAGRKYLSIIKLDKPTEVTKVVSRQSKWEVNTAEWNPHPTLEHVFAIACNQRAELIAWREGHLTTLHTLRAHTRVIGDLNWSPFDSNLLATCSVDNYTYIWDIRDPRRPAISLFSIVDEDEANFNIIDATKAGNLEVVKSLLSTDPDQKNAHRRDDHATPLMFAAMLGHSEIVKVLIEAGADLNAKDTISGWTALMQAIFHGKNNVAKQLLDAGANVSITANNGCSAFDLASLVEDADADLIRSLAAKTLQMKKSSDLRRVNYRKPCSTGNIPQALLASEDVPDSGLKVWWTRMSNRFRNLKLGRTLRLDPIPAAPAPEVKRDRAQKKVKDRPKKRPINRRKEKLSPTINWEPKADTNNPLVASDGVGPTFAIGLPGSLLTSDSIKPVIPPLLPMPSFDASVPNRSGMPAGKVFPAISSNLPVTVQPLRATRLLSTSVGSSLCSPSGSIQLGTPSPQSSNDSGQLKTLLFSTGKKSSSSAQTLTTPITINVSSSLQSSESSHQRTASCPGGLLLSSLTKSPVKALHFPGLEYGHHSQVASGLTSDRIRGSASSKSSKSSSTVTPCQSENAEKSTNSSAEISFLEATLQPLPENDELSSILKSLSLEQYQPIFEDQEVDLEAFMALTDEDLRELGIQQLESRNKILEAIYSMNIKQGGQHPSPLVNQWQFLGARKTMLNRQQECL